MIYGRVIGNELRDVPPECLPVWGQRWAGYRTPHGPSSFSTRIFSVDRMSELAPALTTPGQFEMMEEDEGEDASSESSRLQSSLPSSPVATQTGGIELTVQSETPTPHSFYRSPSQLRCSPNAQGNEHLPPPDLAYVGTTPFSGWRHEQPCIQHHASEPQLHFTAFRHRTHTHGAFWYGAWDSEDDFSHGNIAPSGQPIVPPHYTREWQLANSQSVTSPTSQPDNGHFPRPFQADNQTRFTSMTPPSSFTAPSSIGTGNSTWGYEPGSGMIHGIAHPQNLTVSPALSGLVPPIPSESWLCPTELCDSAPDHRSSNSEHWYGTFFDVAESCVPGNPRGEFSVE